MAAEVTSTATESPAGTGASRRGRRTSAMKSWIGAASGSWKNSTSCGYAQPAAAHGERWSHHNHHHHHRMCGRPAHQLFHPAPPAVCG
jgi:hypothetical protein